MSTSEPIHFEHGNAQFAGTLYKPDSPDPAPVVVVLHAATGALRTYPFYQHLVTNLPAWGIAVFLYDRRGSGESTGTFETADFGLLADDAHAAITALAARPDIDAQRIGLFGISQGAWIVPLVAARYPAVAVLVIVSGCGVTPADQMIYSAQTILHQARYPDAVVATATALRRHVDAYYRGMLPRAVVQAEINEVRNEPWFPLIYVDAELAENVQDDKWYYEMDYEPLAVWQQVQQPTLFLYGEHDAWVPIDESIQRYRVGTEHIRDTTMMQIAGADHMMTHPDAAGEAGTSGHVSDIYLSELHTWLSQRFGIHAQETPFH